MNFLDLWKNKKLVPSFDQKVYDNLDGYVKKGIEGYRNRAIEKCSRSALLELGDKYLDLHKFDAAEHCYKSALKYDDKNIGNKDVHLALSHLCILKEKYLGAMNALSDAVESMENYSNLDELFRLSMTMDDLNYLENITLNHKESKKKFIEGDIEELVGIDMEKGNVLEEISENFPDSENGKKVRLLERALDYYRTAHSTLRYMVFGGLDKDSIGKEIEESERKVLCNLCKVSPKWYRVCGSPIYPGEPAMDRVVFYV